MCKFVLVYALHGPWAVRPGTAQAALLSVLEYTAKLFQGWGVRQISLYSWV